MRVEERRGVDRMLVFELKVLVVSFRPRRWEAARGVGVSEAAGVGVAAVEEEGEGFGFAAEEAGLEKKLVMDR